MISTFREVARIALIQQMADRNIADFGLMNVPGAV